MEPQGNRGQRRRVRRTGLTSPLPRTPSPDVGVVGVGGAEKNPPEQDQFQQQHHQHHQQARELWQKALGAIAGRITRPAFDTWLKGTAGLHLDDHSLTISVPSPFVAEMLEQRMYSQLATVLEDLTGRPLELYFTTEAPAPTPQQSEASPGDPCPDRPHPHSLHSDSPADMATHLYRVIGHTRPDDLLLYGLDVVMEVLDSLTGRYGWNLDHPDVKSPAGLLDWHVRKAAERKAELAKARRQNFRVM